MVLNFTQYAPTVVSSSESFHDGNGYYSAAEQEAVFAGIENIYSQFSSLIKFSLDPAEITQLQGMTQSQLAQIDLTPADVTTLAGLVDPTFQSAVYDGGAGNYETIYFNDTPVFNTGLGTGGVSAAATAILSGGAVTGFTVTGGGAGYSSVPPVTLVSGAGAAATATVANGGITGIAVTSAGASYTSPPTVSITGGGGSGATATAVVTGGQVTAINITSAGTGYTSAPTITLDQRFGRDGDRDAGRLRGGHRQLRLRLHLRPDRHHHRRRRHGRRCDRGHHRRPGDRDRHHQLRLGLHLAPDHHADRRR